MTTRTKRAKSPDVDAIEEDEQQYGSGPLSLQELDEQYVSPHPSHSTQPLTNPPSFPNRPHNHSKTPPFSHLFQSLFNPLMECKPATAGAAGPAARKRGGPGGASSKLSYHEQRRHIIERFMSRWRAEVGPDFYPAMRLILPDKDRDRGVSASWHARTIEGFLYPATYTIEPNATARTVLKQLVTRFDQTASSVNLTRHAKKRHLKPREVLTVASLAQAEGGTPGDYPKVARVIYNRIKRDDYMRFLQLDTTVLYALGERRLRVYNKDTQVSSQYNTYKHPGLPPGPISCPGEDAIRAALHPAKGNWYYFVTTDPRHRTTKFTNSSKKFEKFKKELYRNIGGG